MSICKTLKNDLKEYLNEYSVNEEQFYNFMSYERNGENAISIIEDIVRPNNKDILVGYLTELLKVEEGTRELGISRDHVQHALQTYFLGIWLYEKWIKKLQNAKSRITTFEWKLSSIFHDLAYPLEISYKIINSFFENLDNVSETLLDNSEKKAKFTAIIDIKNIDKLFSETNSFEVIQKILDSWKIALNAAKLYEEQWKKNKICHGIMSSLILLKSLDNLYEQKNPKGVPKLASDGLNFGRDVFRNEIIPACAAIYIHNLKSELIDNKINFYSAPLAFLLKLSDCLQDWERPSKGTVKPETDYDIDIGEGMLYFTVKNQHSRHKIARELKTCLNIKVSEYQDILQISIPN